MSEAIGQVLTELVWAEREYDRSKNAMDASSFHGRSRTSEALTKVKALRAKLNAMNGGDHG